MQMTPGETRTLILEGERPVSWNTYYAGSHWSIRDKEAKRVHALVRAALDPELEPFTGRVSIQITAYVKNKPMDCDNLAGKLYVDGLKGWWFEDDTPDYIESESTPPSKEGGGSTMVEIDLTCSKRGRQGLFYWDGQDLNLIMFAAFIGSAST